MLRLLLLAVLLGANAAPSPIHVTMEEDASSEFRGLPTGWTSLERSHPDTKLELTIAVRQQNTAELERRLMEVSTPGSQSYGQHLTNEEVHALVAPTAQDAQAVAAFLTSHGLTPSFTSLNGDFLEVACTVAQAESLLNAKYHHMQHQPSGLKVHRAMSYSLPAALADAVDFGAPTVHLPPPPS